MPKISILVPIYNVEKYLKECLDSVINQTLRDIEIICINDGSTDSCAKILAEYQNKDSRIKVINKENSGYGISMNMGLDAVTGEYIGIVESDDFVKNTMFEDLYNLAVKNEADIVKSDYFYYTTSNNQTRKSGKISKFIANKVVNTKTHSDLLKMQPSIWSAIYKRELIDTNNVRFLETPGASYQDTAFSFKVLTLAEKIVLTDKAYLYYRQDNVNSSVQSKDKVYMICGEYDEITDFLNKRPDIKEFANTPKLIKQYKAYMWNLCRVDEKFRDAFIEVFSETFKKYYENGEIGEEFYKKFNKKKLELLILDKNNFRIYIDKVINKKNNRTQKRKMFSIRINASRISIVLFGKQILEIG